MCVTHKLYYNIVVVNTFVHTFFKKLTKDDEQAIFTLDKPCFVLMWHIMVDLIVYFMFKWPFSWNLDIKLINAFVCYLIRLQNWWTNNFYIGSVGGPEIIWVKGKVIQLLYMCIEEFCSCFGNHCPCEILTEKRRLTFLLWFLNQLLDWY